ncbi:hypothetical protein [Emticicia sp. 17c]|uniref:hypothetical protein n=1 Tax=Emticicia sp. 17c TaxID=3127704 RepID=UPI00301B8456
MQYPYQLQKLVRPEALQNATGDFESGAPQWVDVCQCRNENSRQEAFHRADGTYLKATHLIQCPSGNWPVYAGDRLRVLDTTQHIRLEAEVIYCAHDYFHTRIWL